MPSSPALQTGAARAAHDWSAIISPERAAAVAARRPNFYVAPHKALRLAMGDALAAVGRVDPPDVTDVARRAAHGAASSSPSAASHLEHENHFVHTAMEARRPGSTARTHRRGPHRSRGSDRRSARNRRRGVRARDGAERQAAAHRLYLRLAPFVAENLVHMHVEETANNGVLLGRVHRR